MAGRVRIFSLICGLVLALPHARGEYRRQRMPPPVLFQPELLKPSGPRPPWPPRRRSGVQLMPQWAQLLGPQERARLELTPQEIREMGLHPRELRALGLRPRGQGLVDLRMWPAEPASPQRVDAQRLGRALRTLCPVMVPTEALMRFARWIVQNSAHFGVDPLLLAALIYQQSRCRVPKISSWGVGLTMINVPMHRPRIRSGQYQYWGMSRGRWEPRKLVLDRFAFTKKNLRRAEPNIYFAAGILKVLSQQCPHMDGWFHSVPHRHAVSHFVWGDRVRGAGVEDRILRARRRLLEYYNEESPVVLGRFETIPLHCPLDGAPHKITSGFDDDRDGGRRRHTGVDFESDTGEPVRAVAAGTVVLAGVDRGNNILYPLDPRLTRLIPAGRMGPRGLLVSIQHEKGLTSSYMHLSAYVVRTGQTIKGGQVIGYVGRSGMKESDAHLHFGLLHNGVPVDPLPHIKPYVFTPQATYVGRNYLAHQLQRRAMRLRHPGQRGRTRPWVGGGGAARTRSGGAARTRSGGGGTARPRSGGIMRTVP